MSILIGKWDFEGPYSSLDYLNDCPGIYIILDKIHNTFNVIDVGESDTVKTRVRNHDRESCWRMKQQGSLFVAVLYTPHLQPIRRRLIEHEIRSQYSPLRSEERR